MNELKCIKEVCKMLDMTPRTIRYYEERGLVKTVRESKTAQRRLDKDNIERLRNIRFLRMIGLSLDEISGVIDSKEKAADLIFTKTAELSAELSSLNERAAILRRVLAIVEKGGDIYSADLSAPHTEDEAEIRRIGAECTRLLLERRFSEINQYLAADMNKLPPSVYEALWDNHIQPCGKFISIGEQTLDGNKVKNRLHFEKLDVIVKIEVIDGVVTGSILQYSKEKET
jgi:DNA-binding transcriptional MerR regulator